MTEDDFTIGDEVAHRTGGKKMIYTGKGMTGEAICEWFDGARRHQETFAFVALKKFEEPGQSSLSGSSTRA
ncbi:DUF2158 domain-containing protein [Mesorhizobium sp. M8A.F.Ca.ET.021.01.1.1]|uniref:YodC family protein n=1 Tax=Mesorhizobium sp. M8A.F.Ca.ET.021.01.1.1 TaxID=2496757 RepID=UPI001676DAFC|nr:DUF2158 domain-containing protein [Mesorhizobium sp. M8A.F.Ca.ET.021.01.1.1]